MKAKHFQLFLTLLLCLSFQSMFGQSQLLKETNVGAELSFSTGGAYEWAWDSSNSRLQSTNKGVQSSTSSTTITFSTNAECTLSFDYQVSSESGYDKLTITLDGNVIVNGISGTVSSTYKGTLPQGSHKMILSYSKDGSADSGDDRGYISNMTCWNDKSGYAGPNLTWTLSGETLTISGSGYMYGYASSDYRIYYDKIPWYKFRDSIKNLIISDQCTQIGDAAFTSLRELTSVTIPKSVTSIGYFAFSHCM